MKRTMIFAIGIAVLMTNTVNASDGKITFRGNLTQKTCTVSVNGAVSPVAATVTLPTVSTSLLDAAGKTAGRTIFEIKLSDCVPRDVNDPDGRAWMIMPYFEAGADVDPVSGELLNRGDATNVRLQLHSNIGDFVKVGDFNHQYSTVLRQWVTAADGTATSRFSVQYKATGVATSGSVASTVTYTIHYQ